MTISDKTYRILKWGCLIFLPALSTLYSTFDGLFGWGYATQVCTALAAVGTFVGTLIGISSVNYNKEHADD